MVDTLEGVLTWMEHRGAFKNAGNVLHLDIDQIYTFSKTYQTAHLRLVFFTVFKVYINFKNLKEDKMLQERGDSCWKVVYEVRGARIQCIGWLAW